LRQEEGVVLNARNLGRTNRQFFPAATVHYTMLRGSVQSDARIKAEVAPCLIRGEVSARFSDVVDAARRTFSIASPAAEAAASTRRAGASAECAHALISPLSRAAR
jgi:hypothetical protein